MNTKNIKLIITILATVGCFATQAADKGGNGGDAVMIGGKPYLLDFAETGIETAPFFEPGTDEDVEAGNVIKAVLPDSPEVHSLVAHKFTELRKMSLGVYKVALAALKGLEFRFVNMDLVDLDDSSTNLKVDPTTLRQVAIRNLSVVQVNRSLWSAMDPENRTGLVFHELFFSMQSPVFVSNLSLKFDSCSSFSISEGSKEIPVIFNSGNTHELMQYLFDSRKIAKVPLSRFEVAFQKVFVKFPGAGGERTMNPSIKGITRVFSFGERKLKDLSYRFVSCSSAIAERTIETAVFRGASYFVFVWK